MSDRLGAVAGAAGSVALAVSAFAMSRAGFGSSVGDSSLAVRTLGRILGGLGLAALFIGWLGVRGTRRPWSIVALWSLPLLLVPPVLSRDTYAYAEQGWLLVQGFNPYVTAMASQGGPFAARVDPLWAGTTTVYPPLALQVQRLVVLATGAHSYWSVVAMRIPAIAGVGLIGLGVPRIARRLGFDPARAVWLALLNPLTIVHLVGGAHNDALATGLLVAAVWASVTVIRRVPALLLGAVLAGLAMAVKQPAGLAVVAVAGLAGGPRSLPASWQHFVGRLAAGLGVVAATFAVVSWPSGLGLGWAAATGTPFAVATNAPAYLVSDLIGRATGVSTGGAFSVVAPTVLISGVAAMVWLLARHGRTEPVLFVALALLVFVIASPSLQAWYLLWGGVLLGATSVALRAARWAPPVIAGFLATAVLQELIGVDVLMATAAAVLVGLATALAVNRPGPDRVGPTGPSRIG